MESTARLKFMIVFSTLRGKELIDTNVSDMLKLCFSTRGDVYGISILDWKNDESTCTVTFEVKHLENIDNFLKTFEVIATNKFKKLFPELWNKYYRKTFSSPKSFLANEYFIQTLGNVDVEQMMKYKKRQTKLD